MQSNDVKKFLEDPDNIDLIVNYKYDELYSRWLSLDGFSRKSALTSVLWEAQLLDLSMIGNKISSLMFQGTKIEGNLVLPSNITEIYLGAFQDCRRLESVEFSNSLERIAGRAFAGCSNLKQIILPEGLQYLGSNCFNGCLELAYVVLPSSLKQVKDNIFRDCFSLNSGKVEYTGTMEQFQSIDGFEIGFFSDILQIVCTDGILRLY